VSVLRDLTLSTVHHGLHHYIEISSEAGRPPEFKHINKGRKRHEYGYS
jgi:hypothetical protein